MTIIISSIRDMIRLADSALHLFCWINDLGQVVQDQNVVDSEAAHFWKIPGGISQSITALPKSGAFNQRIYLACPDLYRVLMIYIGDDVSKEDAIKVAENLVTMREARLWGRRPDCLRGAEEMTAGKAGS